MNKAGSRLKKPSARTNKTPFEGARVSLAGKPALPFYKFYFLMKNPIVGQASDIYEITIKT